MYTRLQTVWSLHGHSRQASKGHSPRCHRRPNDPGRLADKVVQPTTQSAKGCTLGKPGKRLKLFLRRSHKTTVNTGSISYIFSISLMFYRSENILNSLYQYVFIIQYRYPSLKMPDNINYQTCYWYFTWLKISLIIQYIKISKYIHNSIYLSLEIPDNFVF